MSLLSILMNVLDDAGPGFMPGRSRPAFVNVRASETKGFAQTQPRRKRILARSRDRDERSGTHACEVREIDTEHGEETGPPALEAFDLVVPIV